MSTETITWSAEVEAFIINGLDHMAEIQSLTHDEEAREGSLSLREKVLWNNSKWASIVIFHRTKGERVDIIMSPLLNIVGELNAHDVYSFTYSSIKKYCD